jgi:rhodanese-related sulfurtransferase
MPVQRQPGTVAQMLILLAAAVAATIGARFCYDQPIPLSYAWSRHVADAAAKIGVATVSTEQAKAIADAYSHIILDARKPADYHAGRIPGALSLPVSDLDAHFNEIAVLLTPAQPVMVYCSGKDCDESLKLAETLIAAGFTNVALFEGGISAWQDAGLQVER